MLNQCARQVTSIASELDGYRTDIKAGLDWACTCLKSQQLSGMVAIMSQD